MKSQHTFVLKFYLKQEDEQNGKAPIYVRITVDVQYACWALKRSVEPKFWNQKTQKFVGNSADII